MTNGYVMLKNKQRKNLFYWQCEKRSHKREKNFSDRCNTRTVIIFTDEKHVIWKKKLLHISHAAKASRKRNLIFQTFNKFCFGHSAVFRPNVYRPSGIQPKGGSRGGAIGAIPKSCCIRVPPENILIIYLFISLRYRFKLGLGKL